MAGVIINDQELAKLSTSSAKLRKELLKMPVFALGDFLQHVTLRTGIRYSETVGELTGSMELGPYSETRIDSDDVNITPRTLYTFLGSVVKKFSPNKIYQSIWGSNFTKGEALKSTDITQQVLAFLAKKVGEALSLPMLERGLKQLSKQLLFVWGAVYAWKGKEVGEEL